MLPKTFCISFIILAASCLVSLHKYWHKETFTQSRNELAWVYQPVESVVFTSKTPKTLANTLTSESCQHACTLDKQCTAYGYNGVTQECELLPSIDTIEGNFSNSTVRSALKQRPSLSDPKYRQYPMHKLPNTADGTISVHSNVESVNKCSVLCNASSAGVEKGGRCIAFEYDFETEKCKLNSVVRGPMDSSPSSVVYLVTK